jgi:hypothetical protein
LHGFHHGKATLWKQCPYLLQEINIGKKAVIQLLRKTWDNRNLLCTYLEILLAVSELYHTVAQLVAAMR